MSSTPPPPPPREAPPGVRAQFGTTKDAAFELARAHIDLAKAEAMAIGGRVARLVGLIALAFALVFLAGILLVIGSTLFLAEWLLGSMGWGVLQGLLLFTGLAMTAVFAGIGLSGRAIGRATLAALAVAIVVSLILGLGLANRAYSAIGDALAPSLAIEPSVRPLVVGLVIGGLLGLIAGIAGALRGGGWPVLAGATVAGLLLGAVTAPTYGLQVGVALGVTAGYLAWMGLLATAMFREGMDTDALKARFYPTQTIETSKETLEWLKTRLPRANGS